MKRRRIKTWNEQRIARTDKQCAKCDTPIRSQSLYERDVYAARQLEPECVHIHPPCANSYYSGK